VTGLELQLSHYLMLYKMLYKDRYIRISLISSLLVVLFDFMSTEDDVCSAQLHMDEEDNAEFASETALSGAQ
jgi:hypothetical protein